MMESTSNSTTLTTQLKHKQSDSNETYYDRWFVIQAVDDDKPLSKMSPFVIDEALKCAGRLVNQSDASAMGIYLWKLALPHKAIN